MEKVTNYQFGWSDYISRIEHVSFLQSKVDDFSLNFSPIIIFYNIAVNELNDLLSEMEKRGASVNKMENKELIYIEYMNGDSAEDEFAMVINSQNSLGTRSFESWLVVPKANSSIIQIVDKFSDLKLKEFEFDTDYYYIDAKGLQTHSITKRINDFEYILTDIYPGLNIMKLFNSYVHSKENILVLLGKPGVGKTTMIKYFLRELAIHHNDQGERLTHSYEADSFFAYAKGNEVLIREEFWAAMTAKNYKMLILDDLDFALLPREKDQNNFMSNFLSFADGIFDNKTKIVMTTNLQFNEIDKALLRTGRCFDVLNLQPLSFDDAIYIWTKVLKQDIKTFTEEFDRDYIIQSDLMSFFEKVTKKDVNTDYILRDGLSIRHALSKTKKIGFGM